MKKIFASLILFLTIAAPAALSANSSDYDLEAVRLYNMGLEKYRVGAYSSAIEYFKSATQIQPDFYDAYYNMAVTYDYIGNETAAIMVLENLLKQVPEDFASTYKLGQIYYKKGNAAKALELMKKIPPTAQEFPKAQQFITRIGLENKAKTDYGTGSGEVAAKVVPVSKNITGINAPTGIATDTNGNMYVASYSDNAIFKIMPNGIHQLYAKSSQIDGPIGIAIDNNNNMYVANYNKNNVLKIDCFGSISTFISYSNKPYYLFIKNNTLYISEQGSNVVVLRKL